MRLDNVDRVCWEKMSCDGTLGRTRQHRSVNLDDDLVDSNKRKEPLEGFFIPIRVGTQHAKYRIHHISLGLPIEME